MKAVTGQPNTGFPWNARRATAADLEHVLRFRIAMVLELRGTAAGKEALEAATRTYLERALGSGQYASFLVSVDDITAASAAVIFFDRPPIGANLSTLEARLLDVYTRPDYRRRGASRIAVSAAVDHARERGARRVRLGATADARTMYEGHWFPRR